MDFNIDGIAAWAIVLPFFNISLNVSELLFFTIVLSSGVSATNGLFSSKVFENLDFLAVAYTWK
jgi:hypothetical protein